MRRKFSHIRTISRFTPDAFEENLTGVETAKVLILGTELTGKTSIFKQLRRYCGDHPVSRYELEMSKPLCVEHILRVANELSKKCIELRMDGNKDIKVREENEQLIVKYASLSFDLLDAQQPIIYKNDDENKDTNNNSNNNIYDTSHNAFWDKEIGMKYNSTKLLSQLKILFQDPGIIRTYGYCQNELINNAQWFLKRMYSYFDQKFIPTFDDYVRLQSKIGVYDEISKLSSSWNLSITDLCGKRSQRTTWASVINNNYTAILFVASLADFDRYNTISNQDNINNNNNNNSINKNNKKLMNNKLIESMELLKNLVALSYFKNTNIILILNEKDIFDDKLTKHKISFVKHFPIHMTSRFYYKNKSKKYNDNIYNYNNINGNTEANAGGNTKTSNLLNLSFDKTKEYDPNYCIQYIKQQFTNIVPNNLQKSLRIYITCAIATDTFHYVLQTLTQEIIHMEQQRKVTIANSKN